MITTTNRSRSVARLVAFAIAVALFAACDRLPTTPDSGAPARSARAPSRDLSDTAQCLSGFVVVNGIVVCE